MQLVLIRTFFLPLRERSELPQLLLYFSSVFFSLKDNIRGHLNMKIFLADYVPYSITADAIWTIPGVQLAFMASAVTLQGTYCSQLKKIFMGRWPWILSFREKKQN
jgi:hypothetical protein